MNESHTSQSSKMRNSPGHKLEKNKSRAVASVRNGVESVHLGRVNVVNQAQVRSLEAFNCFEGNFSGCENV